MEEPAENHPLAFKMCSIKPEAIGIQKGEELKDSQ
jgi:hypothetical protein